ncbi:MAG: four helix bundle protein [Patescibacteria group bacterium]|nr:four helix bundle protein [Patescibacteria group bacterium]MDD5163995.1 four helix bundle protein [Patescibacteria group bacterium]MDD5534921.1 four helix bundle protein [Patescibacteria group bacterium]
MFRFQKWNIYNETRKLRLDIKRNLLPKISSAEKYILIPQIERAINSIILNIAEGSYRKSDKDFAHFLNQAIASLYEVVACLDLMLDSCYINEEDHSKYLFQLENIARQISAFTRSLKK